MRSRGEHRERHPDVDMRQEMVSPEGSARTMSNNRGKSSIEDSTTMTSGSLRGSTFLSAASRKNFAMVDASRLGLAVEAAERQEE